jgi:hypothetical protein
VFKLKTAKGRLERVAFLRLIHDPLNYVFINQAHRPKVCGLFLCLKLKRRSLMLKYNKIISTLIIITSFWGKFCYATENADKLDNAERGFGNNIQISHQDPLRSELLNQDNRLPMPLANNHEEGGSIVIHHIDTQNRWRIYAYQLMTVFSTLGRVINQQMHYYSSSPIAQEYVCQVAASVTSGVILYGIYQGFEILMSH